MLSLTITTSAEWTTILNLVSWTTKFKIKLWDPCHFASARPWDLPFDPSRTCRGTKSELAPYDLASNSQDSTCDKLEYGRSRTCRGIKRKDVFFSSNRKSSLLFSSLLVFLLPLKCTWRDQVRRTRAVSGTSYGTTCSHLQSPFSSESHLCTSFMENTSFWSPKFIPGTSATARPLI